MLLDELAALREDAALVELLGHYGRLAKDGEDRQAWHDRHRPDGLEGRRLARLHGELIANGWLEQNTGVLGVPRAGEATGCYRATGAGVKALDRLARGEEEE